MSILVVRSLKNLGLKGQEPKGFVKLSLSLQTLYNMALGSQRPKRVQVWSTLLNSRKIPALSNLDLNPKPSTLNPQPSTLNSKP